MMFSVNAEQWATETFLDAELGDLRRTKRLVKITASLANHIGQSIVQSLESAADILQCFLHSWLHAFEYLVEPFEIST